MFAESLLQKSSEVTKARSARTLTPTHLKQCIEAESRFDFLKDLVDNVPDIVAEEESTTVPSSLYTAAVSTESSTRPAKTGTGRPRGRPKGSTNRRSSSGSGTLSAPKMSDSESEEDAIEGAAQAVVTRQSVIQSTNIITPTQCAATDLPASSTNTPTISFTYPAATTSPQPHIKTFTDERLEAATGLAQLSTQQQPNNSCVNKNPTIPAKFSVEYLAGSVSGSEDSAVVAAAAAAEVVSAAATPATLSFTIQLPNTNSVSNNYHGAIYSHIPVQPAPNQSPTKTITVNNGNTVPETSVDDDDDYDV
jgi:hypothetical protein